MYLTFVFNFYRVLGLGFFLGFFGGVGVGGGVFFGGGWGVPIDV